MYVCMYGRICACMNFIWKLERGGDESFGRGGGGEHIGRARE